MSVTQLLKILGYDHLGVEIFHRREFILLVNWLEDRKIRALEVADRVSLRIDSPAFDSAFREYLRQLHCPLEYSSFSDPAVLEEVSAWLVAHAISVDYEDLSEECLDLENAIEVDDSAEVLDGRSCLLDTEVDRLGSLLQISRKDAEKTPEFMIRINNAIRFTLPFLRQGNEAVEPAEQPQLRDFPLGFDSHNAIVNQMSLVLKMLYLWDFRELQTDLNALIMLGQDFTAAPKTNTAMGKVGR